MTIPPKYEDVVAELEVLREGIIALNPESILKQEADYLDQISTLQQRLTISEQRAEDLKKLLCDVINEAPTGFAALKVDLAHRVNDALNPATGRGGCGGGKPVSPSKPVAPPIRRVVNELVINKSEIEAHTTRNLRS